MWTGKKSVRRRSSNKRAPSPGNKEPGTSKERSLSKETNKSPSSLKFKLRLGKGSRRKANPTDVTQEKPEKTQDKQPDKTQDKQPDKTQDRPQEETMEETKETKETKEAKEAKETKEADETKDVKTIRGVDLSRYNKLLQEEQAKIADKEYYHGLMPREEVEDMVQGEGEYLVRLTDTDKGTLHRLVITARGNNKVKHIILNLNKEDAWYASNDRSFDSVDRLVTYYTKNALHVENIRLLHVVKRPEWYLLHENVKLKKTLGSGAFGEVCLGELMVKGKKIEVAVKKLKGQKLGKAERAQFLKEASLNRVFKHPNVVALLGVASQKEPIMVVLEFCPGGQLKSHVAKKTDLKVMQLTKYLLDAAQGMEYLSDLNVIHRDLAARNCLLNGDYVCKISDFGLSCTTNEAKEKKKQRMPVRWLAPEVFRVYEFTAKTDVWSYGIMMWEVYSRCQTDPYPNMQNAEVKKMILEDDKRMDIPPETPPESAEIMKECWATAPEQRPTFRAIVLGLRRAFPDLY
ncbi:unnamed protein product [Bursaphelenchus xylophilus]|uniref:Tyrosine-protein kinase n=1 Tax=Bursaphelenchus xylophilus TaxID=6326 RepID=A0A1I7RRK8_BURXY|nr:unnamed protein product [Bursaphelenchus xylophilus]CAG9131091.1 unnamed protein product [Bursaphelenchus xylophilus]